MTAHFPPATATSLPLSLPLALAGLPRRPRVLHEFFAGGGLARLGFGDGWSCAFANEIDPVKGKAYVDNFGAAELRLCDIAELRAKDLPDQADVAWASFPCTDLSVAGGGAGIDAPRTGAIWHFLDLVQSLREDHRAPRMICLENVPAMLSARHIDGFHRLISRLVKLGYRVGALQVQASLFVPQSRERLFVIAVDTSMSPHLPAGGPVSIWHPKALQAAVAGLSRDVRDNWVWFDLPEPQLAVPSLSALIDPEAGGQNWHSVAETTAVLANMSDVNRQALVGHHFDDGPRHFTACRRTRITATGKKVVNEIHKSGTAGCIRPAKGGASRQLVFEVNNDRVRSRLMSVHEAARLMGLPETYRLPVSQTAALNLLGDAVVVPVVAHLVQHLVEPLLGMADPGPEANKALPRASNRMRGGIEGS